MAKKIKVIGNWKMNANLKMINDFSVQMVEWMRHNDNENLEVAICPPFPYIAKLCTRFKKSAIGVGAQEVSEFQSGAHTGEVSADMLKEIKCGYALIGHSEARENSRQTDEQINSKIKQLLRVGIIPILCVGEPLEIREQNQAKEFVLGQVNRALSSIKPCQLIVAYEPIWAIGTGKTADSETAESMHLAIKNLLEKELNFQDFSIIYGGSVGPKNAKELFSMPSIDGALVGGASLDAYLFKQICGAA